MIYKSYKTFIHLLLACTLLVTPKIKASPDHSRVLPVTEQTDAAGTLRPTKPAAAASAAGTGDDSPPTRTELPSLAAAAATSATSLGDTPPSFEVTPSLRTPHPLHADARAFMPHWNAAATANWAKDKDTRRIGRYFELIFKYDTEDEEPDSSLRPFTDVTHKITDDIRAKVWGGGK